MPSELQRYGRCLRMIRVAEATFNPGCASCSLATASPISCLIAWHGGQSILQLSSLLTPRFTGARLAGTVTAACVNAAAVPASANMQATCLHCKSQWAWTRHADNHESAQGYVVMALEHTDGSGSTAKMAGKRPPLFFSGWMSDEDRPRQIRYCSAICMLVCLPKLLAQHNLGPHFPVADAWTTLVHVCTHTRLHRHCPGARERLQADMP